MIHFSPAKINIGLRVIQRRPDGYHNLQSVMLPIGLNDILEIRRLSKGDSGIRFSQSGRSLDSGSDKNLCILAYQLMAGERELPPVELHLHKQIPVGAGLGGGSSNATYTLKGLNVMIPDPISARKLHELAEKLGSDCPFFLHDDAMMMEGRGEILSPISLHLDHIYLILLFPDIQISTADAYAGITPAVPDSDLKKAISEPVDRWKNRIVNDFEETVFKLYPELGSLKQKLYKHGALYASLSGSGSSIYGLFSTPPKLDRDMERLIVWKGFIRNQPVKNP